MRSKQDAERIMRTFDSLPPGLRDLMNDCPDPRVIFKCRSMLDRGIPEDGIKAWLKPHLKRFRLKEKRN